MLLLGLYGCLDKTNLLRFLLGYFGSMFEIFEIGYAYWRYYALALCRYATN